MRVLTIRVVMIAAVVLSSFGLSCKRQERVGEDGRPAPIGGEASIGEKAVNAVPSGSVATQPADDAVRSAENPRSAGRAIELTGLAMSVPSEWIEKPVEAGPMAPVKIFELPRSEGDALDAEVRVTYFPGMKGMDEMNISRWLSQVKGADGAPATREDAEIRVTEHGSVRLTVVDVAGTLDMSMSGGGPAEVGQRLIAAIVDHPRGPHFIKAAGPAASMARWESSIDAFLQSAVAH